MSKLNWGILGAGAIAKAFARGVSESATGRLQAVGSRDAAKAKQFAEQNGVPSSHGSYEALIADPSVDAVYICTPHPLHAEWTIKAIRAGKHVLCEKPFTVNHPQATAVVEEAVKAGVFLMEAFMYRCHPQTAKLVELIQKRVIGDVRVIRATFSFQSGFNENSRLFANHLAGGGILDVGCYTTSIARLIAGAALGCGVAEPIDVSGVAQLGKTGVDEYALGTLKFEGGILAQIATGVLINQDNTLQIFGSEGRITVPNPYVANRQASDQGLIIVARNGEPKYEVPVEADKTAFGYEVDAFAAGVREGRPPYPSQSIEDTLGNMRTLDRWRRAVGLTYDMEKPEHYATTTVNGFPLTAPEKPKMNYGRVEHVDRPVSRLVMGCDNQISFAQAAVLFDHWFEQGGNTFDTAHGYGGGLHERYLGQWMKHRGVRDQVNVIVKGCHTPRCDPISLSVELKISLERLQMECADIYLMHRDNPQYPASAFVDVLNEHVQAGRIKAFGGSNWSLSRVQEANEYAASKGLRGFTVLSNNLSLARMVNPVWTGCISVHSAESRAWLTERQIANFSWSSQARGFFLPGRATPEKTSDREMVHSWYSDDNFQRLARANELAARKGVAPINIAAAWVLGQPFPSFALIGPREVSETRTSLPGLDVTLTPEEMKWLNLEA